MGSNYPSLDSSLLVSNTRLSSARSTSRIKRSRSLSAGAVLFPPQMTVVKAKRAPAMPPCHGVASKAAHSHPALLG